MQVKMIAEHLLTAFAHQWITDWNKHDVERIVAHYSDAVVFHSPLIPLLGFNENAVIDNKTDLRNYFQKGLVAYPDLYFKLHNVFVGVNTVVIYYTSVNERLASELMLLNNEGKAEKVFCNYSTHPSNY